MNTTTAVVGAGTLALAGHWTQGKGLSIKIAIGVAVLAICLSILSQANEPLARKMGVMLLLAAALAYLPPIAKGLNLNLGKK